MTMRLSAEIGQLDGAAEVHINADRAGLDYLLQQLAHLGKSDHVHLFAPAWGGYDLTEEPPTDGRKPVHHIKVRLCPD